MSQSRCITFETSREVDQAHTYVISAVFFSFPFLLLYLYSTVVEGVPHIYKTTLLPLLFLFSQFTWPLTPHGTGACLPYGIYDSYPLFWFRRDEIRVLAGNCIKYSTLELCIIISVANLVTSSWLAKTTRRIYKLLPEHSCSREYISTVMKTDQSITILTIPIIPDSLLGLPLLIDSSDGCLQYPSKLGTLWFSLSNVRISLWADCV